MLEDKREVQHIIQVLESTKEALENSDSYALQELSNQTVHSASTTQHTDFITIAVMIYSLNKLVYKKRFFQEKKWNSFIKRFSDEMTKSIKELKEGNSEEFSRHLDHAKELLVVLYPNQRQDVEEVLKKASINKAGKIFEHGISLNRTAHLLGITPWELSSYIGQGVSFENPYIKTLDVKKRIKMAQEFFA